MFTGIVAAVGRVTQLDRRGGDLRLSVACPDLDMSDVQLGDSIATQGVCLTVVAFDAQGYTADVSLESVERSTLGRLRVGQRLNLEKAMLATTRFGGHIVSGHVDGIGEILECRQLGRAVNYRVRVATELLRYIAEKGSVTVDGISLTVNALYADGFLLTIVPHTLAMTTLSDWQPGTAVNIEVDVVARYLERLLQGSSTASSSRITPEFLAQHGYLKR